MHHTDMSSREIITRVIEHRESPRIGWNFIPEYPRDMAGGNEEYFHANRKYMNWGRHEELLKKVPWFRGEVRLDEIGNIFGRMDQTQGGECICGVLEEDWELLEDFEFPEFEEECIAKIKATNYRDSGKFTRFVPPVHVFSTLRDARRMENALADTIAEPEAVAHFLEKIQKVVMKTIDLAWSCGVDSLWFVDDWGTQHSPFISPEAFRTLFKPVYKAAADELHNRGMKLMLHSCGKVWDYIPDFIDAGIDVLQFDQMELSGTENLTRAFGKQVTFWASVDIQKVMPTGDRAYIEETARNMLRLMRTYADGSFIARDYGNWQDINVKWEWADWARNIFMNEGWKE